MGLLERIASAARSVALTTHELARQGELLVELQREMRSIDDELNALRERVTRIEAFQQATKAEIGAELARFLAEAERTAARLERALPPGSGKGKKSGS